MLMMAYHTSRYTNAIVCTCKVLVQRESFPFCWDLWTFGTMDLLCFPWQTQNAQCLQSADEPSVCNYSYLKQGACSWLVFVHLWNALQVQCHKCIPCKYFFSIARRHDIWEMQVGVFSGFLQFHPNPEKSPGFWNTQSKKTPCLSKMKIPVLVKYVFVNCVSQNS